MIQLGRVEGQVDRESGFKEVWRAELLSRLELLDQVINEQASRTAFVSERGWDATMFEKRSKLYQITRQHYVALLKHSSSRTNCRCCGTTWIPTSQQTWPWIPDHHRRASGQAQRAPLASQISANTSSRLSLALKSNGIRTVRPKPQHWQPDRWNQLATIVTLFLCLAGMLLTLPN